jgi:NAD(P)-dependent dehydrogenase (short-subunit alcohol dehydrogenase family)
MARIVYVVDHHSSCEAKSMNQKRLQDKVALVTGAGSGIGRAIAMLLGNEGAIVIVADIEPEAARSVTEAINVAGGRAETLCLDVSDEAAWQQATDQVLASHGRLAVVVNNAGVAFGRPVVDTTLVEWRRVTAVNLDGVFLGTKYGIRAMSGKGGSIVNIASVSGIKPFAGASAYGASKAAVRLLTKIAAIECQDAGNGVRVNAVTPGGVKTPMWETMPFFQELIARHGGTEEAFQAMAGSVGSHQFYSAEEVAQTVLFLSSDQSAHLTGVEVVMDRGNTG